MKVLIRFNEKIRKNYEKNRRDEKKSSFLEQQVFIWKVTILKKFVLLKINYKNLGWGGGQRSQRPYFHDFLFWSPSLRFLSGFINGPLNTPCFFCRY